VCESLNFTEEKNRQNVPNASDFSVVLFKVNRLQGLLRRKDAASLTFFLLTSQVRVWRHIVALETVQTRFKNNIC
jgi:hypothetical protein